MSITLTSGSNNNNDIQIQTLTDLSTLQTSAPTLLKLADSIIAGLNQPVSAFPAASSPVTFGYQSGNNSWTLGNFTFGLSGGVSGSVSVVQPGQDLLTYTKTFPTTMGVGLNTETNSATTGKVTPQGGQYYIQVELDLTLTANGAAKVQLGYVGIQGNAGTSDTFKVIFSKSVPGATLLKDALQQAFAGFVLPLHPQTYSHLQPGDYLYHQFNGTLNLGFGATLGLNEVFFSGKYKAAIPNSPAAMPSVTLSTSVGLNVGASFGASFKYTDIFEFMLWKKDQNNGCLHVYRNDSTDLTFTAGATIAVIADPAVSISPVSLSNLAQQTLPQGTGAVAGQILQSSAQTQVTTWVNDAQTKINSWLQPLQQGKTALELTIDDLNSRFLLLDVTFDLTQVGFPSAWNQVVAGDFQAALMQQNGGMTLDPGSGLEDFHHQKTDVTFNLFGKFQAEWSTATITNYSILYAGNNTFNLVEDTGLQDITNINGSGREVDLYFAASGTTNVAGGVQLNPTELHVLLNATKNAKFGNAIAQLLELAATGPAASQLYNQFLAAVKQGNSTQTLELIFAPTAYGKLSSSTLNPDGTITNENLDTVNYNSFADACWESQPGVIADASNFSVVNKLDMTYPVWRAWNEISIGNDPNLPTDYPNRRDQGNFDGSGAVAYLDQTFNTSPVSQIIPFVLNQASMFMNLCEDLVELAVLPANGPNSWTSLLADLGYIIHHDVPPDYLVPTGYALTELVRQAGAQLAFSGPAANASQEPGFAVTLRFS